MIKKICLGVNSENLSANRESIGVIWKIGRT